VVFFWGGGGGGVLVRGARCFFFGLVVCLGGGVGGGGGCGVFGVFFCGAGVGEGGVFWGGGFFLGRVGFVEGGLVPGRVVFLLVIDGTRVCALRQKKRRHQPRPKDAEHRRKDIANPIQGRLSKEKKKTRSHSIKNTDATYCGEKKKPIQGKKEASNAVKKAAESWERS